jgi:hypothetical protein
MHVENFGCGGVCYGLASGYSISLQQQTFLNPKPTAHLFTSSDCSGGYNSAGIQGLQLDKKHWLSVEKRLFIFPLLRRGAG